MPPVRAERWFHTLVVAGASLAGCGGETSEKPAPAVSSSGGVPGTGGTATGGVSSAGLGGGSLVSPAACAYKAQFVCDDYVARTNCRCDPQAPHEPAACDSPLDYTCTEFPCTLGGGCNVGDYVGCHCDPSGLRPTDCATPEQFHCQRTYPFFADCACSPNATPPESCGGNYVYCCQSDSPRFGCECGCAIIK